MLPVSVISGEVLLKRAYVMAAIVVKRTALFLAIVLAWTLLTALARAETVSFSGYGAGTIVVKTGERRLYYVTENGRAMRFPVGVGKSGWAWHGRGHVEGKYLSPAWSPPAVLWRRAGPAPVIPGGSPKNPMGAAALTFNNGELAIHGTNNPGSIGGYVSHGCIRMHNKDIQTLYSLVSVGTPIIVTR
jgi:lipoprotein-anchoring transpeptidase ErfK/SrfK